MSVFIIAEAGVNHNGSIEMAKDLIDVAVESGADAIKFQTFKAESLVTLSAKQAKYQSVNTGKEESQFSMLKRLEISEEGHRELLSYCKSKGIEFMSTPFDLSSIEFLGTLGMAKFKIPSGEITNYPYLAKVGSLKKDVILSTGMATLEEVKDAFKVLIESGLDKDRLTVLHATTAYPTQMSDVNLKAMQTIKKELEVEVGYSDHTLGIEVPVAAVAMGATVIEKHFTLDVNLSGPDHKASLEPDELKKMIEAIRNVSIAMGSGVKAPTSQEIENRKVVRKSMVAAREIYEGDLFTEENLTVKRPGTGLSPMFWKETLGQIAKKNYKEDELL